MRLVLIRHGASHHSALNQIAGVRTCTGLTEQGIRQSERLAERLRSTQELHNCALLLSSPVLRATQTADILADALAADSIVKDDDLCEMQPGDADGLSQEVYRALYGEFDLAADPDHPYAPNGESWHDFTGRVDRTMKRFAHQFEGQTVVAVSHAGFIMASILMLFAIPRPGTGAYLDLANTSLTEWQYTSGVWYLIRYNDVYHLIEHSP
jgi:broad specificity phosphatase PhoE